MEICLNGKFLVCGGGRGVDSDSGAASGDVSAAVVVVSDAVVVVDVAAAAVVVVGFAAAVISASAFGSAAVAGVGFCRLAKSKTLLFEQQELSFLLFRVWGFLSTSYLSICYLPIAIK